MAPTNVAVKSITRTSASNGNYDVHILTQSGIAASFGGQNYGTSSQASNQLQQLLIVSPGTGSPLSLGSGITAHAYPKQALITWTEGRWNIEVSGAPGTNLSILKPPAQQIASILHRVLLPDTTLGVLNWAHGSNGQDSIDLSWQAGATVYWANENHDGEASIPIDMAASMKAVPTP
ncbi:hypothetical protein [Sulfobacillus harzensis]|uniref:Uncharacterized protein n=1 Tax=Sulfobacillus harzensis TaxID=2729629 RepID=A0A7Y0L4X9_9FIRM|nr:hypothetical protein [Sulfobacillus harzensis]NMP23290.1 hypothetical protein [Sulfobacillus harzensis]